MKFKDHFSGQAADYAQFRPRYPVALFRYLSDISAGHERAWDCATGNGQCAISLADFFHRVIATDASEKQIRNATQCSGVDYRVALAEKSGLESDSVDLITVAQALHWFQIEAFFKEAARGLTSKGVLAVWCYDLLEITPEIDSVVQHYYHHVVGAYWPPERKIVEDRYLSIPFPFAELKAPEFVMEASWSLNHLVGYLGTWSATQAFLAAKQFDPVETIESALFQAWKDPRQERLVRWPIGLRIGRKIP